MSHLIKEVKLKKIKAEDFLKFSNAQERKQLLKLTSDLKGKKILHLNSTAIGGGVVEILSSLAPYLRALGIKINWCAIEQKASQKFFAFTNRLHNALQGAPIKFNALEWQFYEKINKKIAADLREMDYDILIINDPQPLWTINYLKDNRPKIYFNHIDTSSADEKTWNKVLPVIKKYQAIIFSNKDFVHNHIPKAKLKIFTPAIDPLSIKQKIIPQKTARKYLKRFGLSDKYPLIVQVSRFDIWKNPLGVIEAFRLVQQSYPQARLALVGLKEAADNPEAEKIYQDAAVIAKSDPNIFLFFEPQKIKNIAEFTMMVQNGADIIVQNSIKEGFGMVVTEAMWKGKAVIGGPASGIKKQIKNNENGFIAETSTELAQYITDLIKDPQKRKRLGRAAKISVKKNFLMPRLTLDHLRLYKSVLKR